MQKLFTALIILAVSTGEAFAQRAGTRGWMQPDAREMRAGILARRIEVSNEFAFGAQYVACIGGRAWWISAEAGAGPHIGPATMRIGALRQTVQFVADPATQGVLGTAAARAELHSAMVAAMAQAPSITIVGVFRPMGLPPQPFTQTIPLRGFSQFVPAIQRQCHALTVPEAGSG